MPAPLGPAMQASAPIGGADALDVRPVGAAGEARGVGGPIWPHSGLFGFFLKRYAPQ